LRGKGPAVSPAITSEIILPEVSVPQNPVRHVDEQWFGEANRPVDQTESDNAIHGDCESR
jgi:hypothetical protein